MNRAWVLPAIALLLLSGCTECSTPFSPLDVPADAPATGGPGSREIQVLLENDDGPTAGSLVAWWIQNEDRIDEPEPLELVTLSLRSEDGVFAAHVPTGRTIHFAAASDTMHTQEWVMDAFAPGTTSESITIHLYDRTKDWTITGTWNDAAGALCTVNSAVPCSSDGDENPWRPHELRFHEDDAINAGYQQRMVFIDGDLSWENTAGDAAAFGVGLGSSASDLECFYDDETENPAPASHTQEFRVPTDGDDCAEAFGWSSQSNAALPLTHVGPRATYLAAPVEGVEYELSGSAGFYHWNPIFAMCNQYGDRDFTVDEAPYNPPVFEDGDLEDADSEPDSEGAGTERSSPSGAIIAAIVFAIMAVAFVVVIVAVKLRKG